MRGEVAALKTSFTEAVETYRKKAKEVSEKYTVTKGEVLKKENLKISKLDEESEEIASMFSAGKKPLTDFINEYMDKRVAYHELQGKVSAAEKDMV